MKILKRSQISQREVPFIKRLCLTTRCRWLVFESQFKIEQRRGQHQREQVCDNYRHIMNDDTVNQPEQNAKAEEGKHAQRKIFSGAALPGFDYLWQKSNGGTRTSR